MATLLLASAGGVLGGAYLPTFLGVTGASWGMMAGQIAGTLLFPPEGQTVQGPRLSNLDVGSASEGADIPQLWGNVRIAGQLIMRAPATEKKNKQSSGGKGGGAEVTSVTYSYRCTFAVSFGVPKGTTCRIRRIYLNKKVYVDLTGNSNVQQDTKVIYNFYDGTQTDPDPLLESRIGIDNVSAYKGQVYIVFDELDLTENFGNTLPAVEVELAIDGTTLSGQQNVDLFTSDEAISGTLGIADNMGSISINRNTDKIITCWFESTAGQYTQFLVEFDPYSLVPTRKVRIQTVNGQYKNHFPFSRYGEYDENDLIMTVLHGAAANYQIFDTTSWSWLTNIRTTASAIPEIKAETESYIFSDRGSTSFELISKLSWDVVGSPVTMPTDRRIISVCGIEDTESDFLILANNAALTASYLIRYTASTGFGTEHQIINNGQNYVGREFAGGFRDDLGNYYWGIYKVPTAADGDYGIVVSDEDGNIQDYYIMEDQGLTPSGYWPILAGCPGIGYDKVSKKAAIGNFQYAMLFDTRSRKYETYTTVGVAGAACYHWQSNRMFGSAGFPGSSGSVAMRYCSLALNGTSPVSVSQIITDMCAEVGVDASKLDITTAKTLLGFVHKQQATARQNIDTILQISLCDGVLSDWEIKVKDVGASSVVTIPYSNLGARDFEQEAEAPLTRIEPEIVDIPRVLNLNYISKDLGLQPGHVRVDWASTTSNRQANIQVPATFTDSDAATLAKQLLQLMYENVRFKFNLPRDYAYLDPGDTITLDDENGNLFAVKLLSMTRGANDVIECEGVSEDADNLTAYADSGSSGYTPPLVTSTTSVSLLYLNTPLLRDIDLDHPGPYLAAYSTGFYSASVAYSSVDDIEYNQIDSIVSDVPIGFVKDVPTSVDWENWDNTNTIEVEWLNDATGRLSSTSDANILAGANFVAYGRVNRWELMQVGTVTPVSADVDQFSHLLRGRRGTDVYKDTHAWSDYIIVLTEDLIRQVLNISDIGNSLYYKLVPSGNYLSNAVGLSYTVKDTALQPYTPISPVSQDDTPSAGDITMSATARARRGGVYGGANSLTDGVGTVDSNITGWRFQILDAVDGNELNSYDSASLNRVYTAAEQLADYGVSAPTVYWRVSAISNYITTPERYCPTQTVTRP